MAEHSFGTGDNEQNPDRRITIQGARKMLGMIGQNYDDEDITEVLNILYGIAEEAFEFYSINADGDDEDEDEDD